MQAIFHKQSKLLLKFTNATSTFNKTRAQLRAENFFVVPKTLISSFFASSGGAPT